MADPMREAFERRATELRHNIDRGGDGLYCDVRTQVAWLNFSEGWAAASAPPAAMPDGKPLPQVSRDDLASLIVRAACETEPADPDDPETIKIRTHDLKWAALAAFELADLSPAIPQEAPPVAVIRFDRGTAGNENEMPRVVSCSWLPDGEHPVYAAPPAAIAQEPDDDPRLGQAIDERDAAEEMADQLADAIAMITGAQLGEHSSANCPWINALTEARDFGPGPDEHQNWRNAAVAERVRRVAAEKAASQLLSAAIATERERCASIADKREARCGRQSERAVARLIAAAIRRTPGAEDPL